MRSPCTSLSKNILWEKIHSVINLFRKNFKRIKLFCKKYLNLFSREIWQRKMIESITIGSDFCPLSSTFYHYKNFLLSLKFSFKLRIFFWVENFLSCWEFSFELSIFFWLENYFCCESVNIFPGSYKKSLIVYIAYNSCCEQNPRKGRSLYTKNLL